MKNFRSGFIRLVFVVAVLSCFGVSVSSSHDSIYYNQEYFADLNLLDDSFSSEIDSLDDDEILHINEFLAPDEVRSEFFASCNICIYQEVSSLIWQPPQNT